MSKICQITGKRAMVGNNVSHSKRRTKRKFNVNLFTKKLKALKKIFLNANLLMNFHRAVKTILQDLKNFVNARLLWSE